MQDVNASNQTPSSEALIGSQINSSSLGVSSESSIPSIYPPIEAHIHAASDSTQNTHKNVIISNNDKLVVAFLKNYPFQSYKVLKRNQLESISPLQKAYYLIGGDGDEHQKIKKLELNMNSIPSNVVQIFFIGGEKNSKHLTHCDLSRNRKAVIYHLK